MSRQGTSVAPGPIRETLWPSAAVASAMLAHHAYRQLERDEAEKGALTGFALPERLSFGRTTSRRSLAWAPRRHAASRR